MKAPTSWINTRKHTIGKEYTGHTVGVAWEARGMSSVWEWAWEDVHCLQPSPLLAHAKMPCAYFGRKTDDLDALR